MVNINGFEHEEILTSYFNDIQNIRVLSAKEEKELAFKIKKGDKNALNKLVYHNLRFVVMISKLYRERKVSFSDLISEGNMGLIKAAHKFDPNKNVKFITYAVWWIRNAMEEFAKQQEKIGNTVEANEINVNNNMDIEYRYEMINDDFETKINNIQSRKDTIELLMQCLHEREIQILTLFYGLNDGKEMTLDEVGKKMNLTNERVRQIKDCAISKLKCKALSYSDKDIEMFKSLR